MISGDRKMVNFYELFTYISTFVDKNCCDDRVKSHDFSSYLGIDGNSCKLITHQLYIYNSDKNEIEGYLYQMQDSQNTYFILFTIENEGIEFSGMCVGVLNGIDFVLAHKI